MKQIRSCIWGDDVWHETSLIYRRKENMEHDDYGQNLVFLSNRAGGFSPSIAITGRLRAATGRSSSSWPPTTSKNFGLRFFYFVFAGLLYSIWRAIDLLIRINDTHGHKYIRDLLFQCDRERRVQHHEGRLVLEKAVPKFLIKLSPALFRGVTRAESHEKVTHFDQRVFDERVFPVRREIRGVIQDTVDFFAELGLKCFGKTVYRVDVKIVFTEERISRRYRSLHQGV